MSKKENKFLLVLTILLIICLSLVSMLYGGLYVFAITNVVKVCSLLLMCVLFLTKYIMIYGLTLDIFKDRLVRFRVVRRCDNFIVYANGDIVGRFNSRDIPIISMAHSNGVFLDNICFKCGRV